MITMGDFSQEDPLIKRIMNRGLIGSREMFHTDTIVSTEIINEIIDTYEKMKLGPYETEKVLELVKDLRVLLTYIIKKEKADEQNCTWSRVLRHCC